MKEYARWPIAFKGVRIVMNHAFLNQALDSLAKMAAMEIAEVTKTATIEMRLKTLGHFQSGPSRLNTTLTIQITK